MKKYTEEMNDSYTINYSDYIFSEQNDVEENENNGENKLNKTESQDTLNKIIKENQLNINEDNFSPNSSSPVEENKNLQQSGTEKNKIKDKDKNKIRKKKTINFDKYLIDTKTFVNSLKEYQEGILIDSEKIDRGMKNI